MQDSSDIGRSEHFCQVFDRRLDTLIDIDACDMREQLAQKWIGLGYQLCRLLTTKGIERVIMQPRGKHAISEGLRVDIGKVSRREIMDKY